MGYAYRIALGWNLYVNVHPLLSVYLAFTQIDIIGIRIILELAITYVAVKGYLNAKIIEPVPDNDDSFSN